MKAKSTDIKAQVTALFKQLTGPISMEAAKEVTNKIFELLNIPSWQRPYDWNGDVVIPIMQQILETASYPEEDRKDNQTYLGTIVVYDDPNGSSGIADGHSRAMTLGIIIKALKNLCLANNYNVAVNEEFDFSYALLKARTEYQKFVTNTTAGTNYGDVYRTIYKMLDEYVSCESDVRDVLDVIKNHVTVCVISCASEEQAHQYFMEQNASGRPLTKTEIVSSFLEFYARRYKLVLEYDYDELENIIDSYIYVATPNKVPTAVNNYALNRFMSKNVVDSRPHFVEFKEYLKNIKTFTNTIWYKILSILDKGKAIKVAYTLAGCRYDLSGRDEAVNELLSSMFVFEIVSFTLRANNGASVTSKFNAVKTMIGNGMPLETITASIKTWAADLYEIDMNRFEERLDEIRTDAQKAILYFTYFQHNKNSIPYGIHLEDSYPVKPSVAWKRQGWPTESKEQKLLSSSIGNKVLLAADLNEVLGNASPAEKEIIYDEFFENNSGFNYKENQFNWTKFKADKKNYLNVRRHAYAKVLANTAMGKMLVKQ